MSHPIVRAVVTLRNPDWVRGGEEDYYIKEEMEVEVLTLNLNACSMRVRVPGYQAQDLSIGPFLDQYEIVRRKAE